MSTLDCMGKRSDYTAVHCMWNFPSQDCSSSSAPTQDTVTMTPFIFPCAVIPPETMVVRDCNMLYTKTLLLQHLSFECILHSCLILCKAIEISQWSEREIYTGSIYRYCKALLEITHLLISPLCAVKPNRKEQITAADAPSFHDGLHRD